MPRNKFVSLCSSYCLLGRGFVQMCTALGVTAYQILISVF
jgi:hypothetical protein